MKYEKFLNIGSVVLLKGGEKRVMVIGYLPMPDDNDLEKIYDYIGCIFPEGLISSDEMLVFNHDQIDKVYSIGYEDDETKSFKENLNVIYEEIQKNGVDQFKKNIGSDSNSLDESEESEESNESVESEETEETNPEDELNIEEVN